MTIPQPSPQEPEEAAREMRLHYVHGIEKGYNRRPHGKDFTYLTADGKSIREKKTLDRIKSLVIPPAWKDVWICPFANGHLQATGIDEKGRKQYIYHKDWIAFTQETKFSKMPFFATVLPAIRKEIRAGLAESSLTKRRVLATALWLLDKTFLRIGNTEYSKENDSFGITTLRTRHVTIEDSMVTLEFKGKSGVFHKVPVSHPRVVRTIRRLEALPGYELFQYVDDEKQRRVIDSADVNDYLRSITGEAITAKDFRTWAGTVLSGSTLYSIGQFSTKNEAKKNVTTAVKQVAKHLRNTPATCRSYYIHPVVISSYQKNVLVPHFDAVKKNGARSPGLTFEEIAAQTLLEKFS